MVYKKGKQHTRYLIKQIEFQIIGKIEQEAGQLPFGGECQRQGGHNQRRGVPVSAPFMLHIPKPVERMKQNPAAEFQAVPNGLEAALFFGLNLFGHADPPLRFLRPYNRASSIPAAMAAAITRIAVPK